MNYQTFQKRKEVETEQCQEVQKQVIKDYTEGVGTFTICRKHGISESAMYRILQGHLGGRPSMFRGQMSKKNKKLKNGKKIKSVDSDRIKELEKLIREKDKQIEKHQKEIQVVKEFLGKF